MSDNAVNHNAKKGIDLTVCNYACLIRPKIVHKNYSIRTVRPCDIEFIRLWRNAQLEVLRQEKEISQEAQINYYQENVWPSLGELEPKNLLLAYLLDDNLIGYGGLVHIAWKDRRAEVSFLLNPARASNQQLYEREFSYFLELIKTLAFEDLDLNKIYTETYATRVFHMKIIETAGFKFEGRLQQHIIRNNQPIDSIIHGYIKNSPGR